ncbi:MAG: serine/threonine-protein phosphatase [Planctomycetes bacterium]|nr:serine/threonine-protein phosphatase [Planctomycetota bacterium]
MTETQLFNAIGIETETTDIIFVTDQEKMPHQIGKTLMDEGRSWEKIGVERFIESFEKLGEIRTVVVDTSEVEEEDRRGLLEALKRLEEANTAAILLNDNIDFPFDEFEHASLLKSASFDELWGRIDSNIKFRDSVILETDQTVEEAIFAKPQIAPEHSADMVEQLKMAGRVQRDFLPTDLPDSDKINWAAYFEPAEWVSGDIYDITRLDEQHIGFYLADAVGHSMPAALLTMFIKQAIVMRQTKGNDYSISVPVEVMSKLNSKMSEQNLSGCLFATCCYGLINSRTLQMTYCRGGHPYPILKRNGEEPIQLQAQGGLLGIFPSSHFEQETVQLKSGDKLVIYSDGLDEIIGENADSSDDSFIFNEEFREALDLPVKDMMAKIKQLAKNTNQKFPDKDDRTAIALEIL